MKVNNIREVYLSGLVRGGQLVPGGLHAPDFAGVLRDGAVRRELARRRDVLDHHLRPFCLVLVTL